MKSCREEARPRVAFKSFKWYGLIGFAFNLWFKIEVVGRKKSEKVRSCSAIRLTSVKNQNLSGKFTSSCESITGT
jgi:hypothetical protein